MKKNLLVLTVPFFTSSFAVSQSIETELIGTSGETFANESMIVDWSMGEIATETFQFENYLLSQGFQQGRYEISSLVQGLETNFQVTVFPNPTSDYIKLKMKSASAFDIVAQIVNMQGKTLFLKESVKEEEIIDFSTSSIGSYILILRRGDAIVQSLKIVKN